MADIAQQPAFFEGNDPKECEVFIANLRRLGLAQGRIRDNEYMADLASTYFVGDALYWFEDLEDSVQSDWGQLRRALLARFGRRRSPTSALGISESAVPSSSSVSSIPTPAAAPILSSSLATCKGRMKFIDLNGGFPGYLGISTCAGEYASVSKDPLYALAITLPAIPGTETFEIWLKDTDAFGVTWSFNYDVWEKNKIIVARCCSCPTIPVKNGWASASKVWTTDEDENLSVRLQKSDGSFETLQAFVQNGLHFAWVWTASTPVHNWLPVNAVFEKTA